MNRALLVGINKYPSQPLRGCVNDVEDMANFLVSKCNFDMRDIRLLVDERATKAGIIERLGWLLTGIKSGDRILFHYSGHGAQLATRNPQGEVDNLDEVICPVDFDWTDEHAIRDKEFNRIFSAIPEGVEFIWVSDSCHSGDLSKDIEKDIKIKTLVPPADINWRIKTAENDNIKDKEFTRESSSFELNLALITGCKSNQTSADAVFDNKANGALTYFLLQELNKSDGTNISIINLLQKVTTELKLKKFQQEPQLEGNEIIKSKAFLKL